MFLAIRELGRAKVRFLLLGGAVGLLVFLILFQQALLGGLITQFIGALRNQSATVLCKPFTQVVRAPTSAPFVRTSGLAGLMALPSASVVRPVTGSTCVLTPRPSLLWKPSPPLR